MYIARTRGGAAAGSAARGLRSRGLAQTTL